MFISIMSMSNHHYVQWNFFLQIWPSNIYCHHIAFDVTILIERRNSVKQNTIVSGTRCYHFTLPVWLTNEIPRIDHVKH